MGTGTMETDAEAGTEYPAGRYHPLFNDTKELGTETETETEYSQNRQEPETDRNLKPTGT